jgi:hypothetical protein
MSDGMQECTLSSAVALMEPAMLPCLPTGNRKAAHRRLAWLCGALSAAQE